MSLQGHYQNAYVAHDLDRAMELISGRHGVDRFLTFDADMALKTPGGEKPAHFRVALGWAGPLQIELIQPVSGHVEAYAAYLPADRADPSPRLHHVAVRRDDLDAMRRAALFEEIHALSAQAWMTGTDLSLFHEARAEIFEVRDGMFHPQGAA